MGPKGNGLKEMPRFAVVVLIISTHYSLEKSRVPGICQPIMSNGDDSKGEKNTF